MRGSRNFCQGCPGPTARNNALAKFLFLFCPQLLLFYSGLLMVYFKESYNFTRFRGLERVSNIFQEGPTFSRGDQTFSRGGGGPNTYSRNP